MKLSQWFQDQLKASGDGFAWAVEQVPIERRHISPPGPLGEWPADRHVFHMLYYEEGIALPVMWYWLGEPFPSLDGYDEDAAWAGGQDLETMLARFQKVRAEQIGLLPQFSDVAWNEQRDTPGVWGPVTLRWVVTKTYQHTAEHTHDVLRMALFWDMFVKRL